MPTVEARRGAAGAPSSPPGRSLRPAAASSLGPSWLHTEPVVADVVAVFDEAVYLRRDQDVLPLLAPDALLLPGALRVPRRADLAALRVHVGDRVLAGQGQVVAPGGGLVVRRVWRPQPAPCSPLSEPARQVALAALAGLPVLEEGLRERLSGPAASATGGDGTRRTAAVRALVGLGPGLTPAGDDVLCGLLLGLHASGRAEERSLLEAAVLPLLARTTALSATLLRQAAQGYAVPPVVGLLRAWHRGAGAATLEAAGRQVTAVGHTSGPALVLGLTAALAAPSTTRGTP